ncbi:MAG: alpha/beta fold hydrolase [Planctomycetota bacterium]
MALCPRFLAALPLFLLPPAAVVYACSPAAAKAPETAEAAALPAAEELALETSDGLSLSAWYYAVPEDADPLATVILVHDLDGSHKSVEPLALALQKLGCAVVAPDLRGHGASTVRTTAGGREETLDPKTFKKSDLELIAAAMGGSVREQSAIRGDIEAVRNFIKQKSDAGELDIDRLCVVGSGTGATLAALWTAADWAWLPIASGPQGRQVRALVLISPIWATKGLSISPALSADVLKRQLPIMVLAGKDDRDATRLVDQLKKQRPKEWFEQRAGQQPAKAKDLEKVADATIFFMQADSTLSGDKLAADRSTDPGDRVKTFLSLVLDRNKKR